MTVVRYPITFRNQDSYLVIFKDTTAKTKLNTEREKTKRLRRLNASVQYEMVTTLGYNIDLAEILCEKLTQRVYRPQLKLIMVASKMVLMQAQDLLDQYFIEHGAFQKRIETDSPVKAIYEVVNLMQQKWGIDKSNLKVDVSNLTQFAEIKLLFDR